MFNEQMEQFEARPKNFGPMKDASARAKIAGPCGDTVEVWLRIDGGKIRKASFMTDGCAHSSMCCGTAVRMTEGMPPEAAAEISQEEILEAVGPVPEDHQHCALLAANTIKKALENYSRRPARRSLKQKFKHFFKSKTPENNHV